MSNIRFNRRSLLIAAAGKLASASTPRLRAELVSANSAGLKDFARSGGYVYGSAVQAKSLADGSYAKLVASQCDLLVPEIELKWNKLQPVQGRFEFSEADQIVRFARANGQLVRGHTLVWHDALPPWAHERVTRDNARSIMCEHIRTVVSHYRGQIQSWDVVNEAIEPNDGALRSTIWSQTIGPEYIALAFATAHDADPSAKLVYNDTYLEYGERNRLLVYAMLRDLKRKEIPIHGVGIQSHIWANKDNCTPKFWDFLRSIEDLGLEILITELDVRDNLHGSTKAEIEARTATAYASFLSFMLRCSTLKTIVTWGLSSRYSWITWKSNGSEEPLPFDEALLPTPAFDALKASFTTHLHEGRL